MSYEAVFVVDTLKGNPTMECTWTGKNITGYTMTLVLNFTSGISLTKTGVITDGPNGDFQFGLLLSELPSEGLHPGYIKANDNAGGIDIFRNLKVRILT